LFFSSFFFPRATGKNGDQDPSNAPTNLSSHIRGIKKAIQSSVLGPFFQNMPMNKNNGMKLTFKKLTFHQIASGNITLDSKCVNI
jgi:hypothetical protein